MLLTIKGESDRIVHVPAIRKPEINIQTNLHVSSFKVIEADNPNTTFCDIAKEAVKLAQGRKVSVLFILDGIAIMVHPSTSMSEAMDAWKREFTRRMDK